MSRKPWPFLTPLGLLLAALGLTACNGSPGDPVANRKGFELSLLVGSALGEFCQQAAAQFNQQQPQLPSGEDFYLTCRAEGSGDVVTQVVTLAQQLKNGTLPATAPEFPSLISVDGEIYQDQLIYRMNQLFPGQNYIPQIPESPLIVSSPMVFMAQSDLAVGLRQTPDLFQRLATAKTHREIDPNSPPIAIHYVHTAPTRSNSGLQTLVAQFAALSGKRPEELTVAEVQRYTPQVQQLQRKITRYGVSTDSLARSMAQNGPFWASIGSVYESSVIAVNSTLPPGQPRFEAIYPPATFSSNMRAILPQAPWVSAAEKAAAEQVIAYLRSPAMQQLAANLGLRPGVPGIPLGPKFSPEFGVEAQVRYDSYRPPRPEVVEAMLQAWENAAKKPSLVVVVVDSSGSMGGNKLPAVQNTLQTYINSLGPQDQLALIDFDSDIRLPVRVDGTPEGRDRGYQFINNLRADGGTRLYDAVLAARNWLQQNRQPEAINAVLILTDGEDSGSRINLQQLKTELGQSGFNTDQRLAFFTVGYGNEGEFNPTALKQIAELNGGYYSKGDPTTISRLMGNLQVEF